MGSRISHIRKGAVWGDDSDLFDHFDKGAGRAVADRGLVGIHLKQGVVHTHAGESGNDMFNRVDLHRTFGEGGGPLDGLDFFHIGVDERLVWEIDAAELEAVTFRCGFDGQADFLPGVERGAFESGLAG
jgi:hypothetical protein